MKRTNLLYELLRVTTQARNPEVAARLAAAGVPVQCRQAWGFDNVEVSGRNYTPAPHGTPAVIVPHFEAGQLLDLVAVGLRSRACRTLTGICTVLGIDCLERARGGDEPVRFYADPIRWFAQGRDGAVVIDWRSARYELRDLPGIACDDEVTAKRIDKALREPVDMPPIFVREADHAA